MATEVVDIAHNLCGSDSIFQSNPIQRWFQDAHVITQQIQGRMAHYDTAGSFSWGWSLRVCSDRPVELICVLYGQASMDGLFETETRFVPVVRKTYHLG